MSSGASTRPPSHQGENAIKTIATITAAATAVWRPAVRGFEPAGDSSRDEVTRSGAAWEVGFVPEVRERAGGAPAQVRRDPASSVPALGPERRGDQRRQPPRDEAERVVNQVGQDTRAAHPVM